MRTRLLCVFCTAVVGSLLFSCNKSDTINELALPSSAKSAVASTTCDFSDAAGTGLKDYDDDSTYLPIFSKTYDVGTNRISGIKTAVIDDGFPQYYQWDIVITYKGNDMICFSKTANDTIAVITLDPTTKKPVTAIARAEWDIPESKTQFRFTYVYGHLTGILFRDWFLHPDEKRLRPYITLQYQDTYKHIHQLFFGALNSTHKIVYTYDKKKSFTGQFYPDEQELAYWSFWAFLRQLNFFPELQPQYRLIQAYLYNPEYPGDQVWNYSNQKADASGRLISYDVRKHYAKYNEAGRLQHFTLNWQCNRSQNIK